MFELYSRKKLKVNWTNGSLLTNSMTSPPFPTSAMFQQFFTEPLNDLLWSAVPFVVIPYFFYFRGWSHLICQKTGWEWTCWAWQLLWQPQANRAEVDHSYIVVPNSCSVQRQLDRTAGGRVCSIQSMLAKINWMPRYSQRGQCLWVFSRCLDTEFLIFLSFLSLMSFRLSRSRCISVVKEHGLHDCGEM